METIQDLVDQQEAVVDALKKRIAGLDAMLLQGREERSALVADILKEMGHLEGLKAALTLEAKTETQRKETDDAARHESQ